MFKKRLFICLLISLIFTITSCSNMFIYNLEKEFTTGTWSGDLYRWNTISNQITKEKIGNIKIIFNGDKARVIKNINGSSSESEMFYTKVIVSKEELKEMQGYVTQLSYTDIFMLTEKKPDKRPLFSEIKDSKALQDELLGKNGISGYRLHYNFLGVSVINISSTNKEDGELYQQ